MATVFKFACTVFLMALGQNIFVAAFKPPGKYDIGPADLNALCPMVKEFGETGLAPKPAIIKEAKTSPHGCIYFQWVTCPEGESDPMKPCGWYEMKKCDTNPTAGRSGRAVPLASSRGIREKRSKVISPEGFQPPSPVIIDFASRTSM